MTRDEILAMPAGREMDALIWTRVWNGGTAIGKLPLYSTDIEAAWNIVEKLGLNISQKNLNEFPAGYEKSKYMADPELRGKGEFWLAWGETAPLAICRAALIVAMETR